jgi:hypothetical protein
MQGNFPMRNAVRLRGSSRSVGETWQPLTALVIGPHCPRFRLSSASPIYYYGLLHADLGQAIPGGDH